MKIRLKEHQGRMADRGERVTLEEIAKATGINVSAIYDIATGKLTRLPLVQIDALCAFFGIKVGDLLEEEPVTLPLPPARPDRRGARVGERTKNKGK